VTRHGDEETETESGGRRHPAHDRTQGGEEDGEGQEDLARQVSSTVRSNDSETRRREALGAYLDERVAEGFRVESRTDTQAIIAPAPSHLSFLRRFRKSAPLERQVVAVDVDGNVTASPAQPLRS
jgi:hypothetical protein